MALLLLSYLAGVLTIATPCILPVLPLVAAGWGNAPWRRGTPLLLGLALSFAVTASLAAVAGEGVVVATRDGRLVALALLALFGLSLLWPVLARRLTTPLGAAGGVLAAWAERRGGVAASLLLGVAIGLIWAPCTGPVLGVVLTAAALNGPGIGTTLALAAYGLGAATALAIGMAGGGRLLAVLKRTTRFDGSIRRALGVAVLAGVALAAWPQVGARLPSLPTDALESRLLAVFGGTAHAAALEPILSGPLAALPVAPSWINTPPLTAADLKGKVVLVNFWTYSCINCLRVLPHVRTWAAQYRDQGLVVVGIHTPEFAFEKDRANVTQAASTLAVTYPVVQDNDFRLWRAFDNNAWPALYLIDAQGRIRYRAVGEGAYARTEQAIRQVLAETPVATAPAGDPMSVTIAGTQVAADEADLASPETYVGYAEGARYAGPDAIVHDAVVPYRPAPALSLNHWGLAGNWAVGAEYATLDQPSGRIAFRFHARDLHLVLAPGADGRPIRFRIRVDGAAPGAGHGADVDAEGLGTVRDARLYQLVRQAGPVADHTFEIEFLDAGVRAYAFTFG
ncbi:MAG: redoxin domain-containing protein [Azospirillaceae bacterium]|nr:redoxin domain-containing protein [Azospirillaceae bacterium]